MLTIWGGGHAVRLTTWDEKCDMRDEVSGCSGGLNAATEVEACIHNRRPGCKPGTEVS